MDTKKIVLTFPPVSRMYKHNVEVSPGNDAPVAADDDYSGAELLVHVPMRL